MSNRIITQAEVDAVNRRRGIVIAAPWWVRLVERLRVWRWKVRL